LATTTVVYPGLGPTEGNGVCALKFLRCTYTVAIELRYGNPHGEQFPWSIELCNLHIATL